MTPLEQKIREHFMEYMNEKVRLTSSGELHPDEARAIARHVLHSALSAGYVLRADRRIVVEMEPGRWVISVTAQSTESCARFDICDPAVWQQLN